MTPRGNVKMKMKLPTLTQVGDFVLYGSKYDRRKYYKGHLLYNLPLRKFPTVCLTGFIEWYETYAPKNKNMVIFKFEYHVMKLESDRRAKRCLKKSLKC